MARSLKEKYHVNDLKKEATTPDTEQSVPANVTPLREVKRVADAADIESLWLDPKLGDGIVNSTFTASPSASRRTTSARVPDPAYRRRCEIYIHKVEGVVDEQHYILAPNMRGRIDEAMPCTLVTVVYRDGTPRLWVIKFPKDGEAR